MLKYGYDKPPKKKYIDERYMRKRIKIHGQIFENDCYCRSMRGRPLAERTAVRISTDIFIWISSMGLFATMDSLLET